MIGVSDFVTQAHFEDNPLDLEYLRHDKPLHPTRVQPHMKHVPKYLMPRVGAAAAAAATGTDGTSQGNDNNTSFVPFRKSTPRGRGRGRSGRGFGGPGRGGKKKSDPLKKFGR